MKNKILILVIIVLIGGIAFINQKMAKDIAQMQESSPIVVQPRLPEKASVSQKIIAEDNFADASDFSKKENTKTKKEESEEDISSVNVIHEMPLDTDVLLQ